MTNSTPKKSHKIFVLLSGGIDSTTTLAIAKHEFPYSMAEAVTMDYGQRHKKEAEFAAQQASLYEAEHVVLNLAGLMTGMLVNKAVNEAIPNASYADLPHGISPTYVSYRNGLMLSALTARAQGWVMEQEKQFPGIDATATLYCGVHADDGATEDRRNDETRDQSHVVI